MPKSLTVSQLLGRGQLTPWETRSHRPLSPPHWGEGRQEGPEGPGLPEGERSAALRGLGRVGQGKVFAWHWAGPSPVWESGHSGENSVSGKTGIHFKISAQKGQQGCSQARLGPPSPYDSPHEPCSPQEGPWRPWWSAGRDTTSVTRQGRERRCPHGSLNTEE